MEAYKRGSHTVWNCKYHRVWVTKYRHQVLVGDVGSRSAPVQRTAGSTRPTWSARSCASGVHPAWWNGWCCGRRIFKRASIFCSCVAPLSETHTAKNALRRPRCTGERNRRPRRLPGA